MIFTTILLATMAAAPAIAIPTATSSAAAAIVSLVFCTDASYSPEDPYPWGTPMGAGVCFVPDVQEGKCYNWADFPRAEAGPMIHNVSFTHIGNNFQCDVYKTHHCKGASFSAEAGDEDYNNKELADVSFNNEIASFLCTSA